MNGSSITHDKYEVFKSEANDVVEFKLVRCEDDICKDGNSFRPEMTHQVFGENEIIFGYCDLKIQIFCSAARFYTYVNVKFSEKIDPDKHEGLVADDIYGALKEKFTQGYTTNLDEFLNYVRNDNQFKPYGECIDSYTNSKDGIEKTFCIYKHNIDVRDFKQYHERIQPFLLFYVDAASYIECDDDKWSFFLLYEKYKNSSEPNYAFIGYMTVYNYYAYPQKIRPRISQALILPPFQRQGHATKLLQSFYHTAWSTADVLDITVEDPSEDFQRVRDFVDTKNCMLLDCFSADCLQKGFSQEMINEAQKKLKLNKKQSRRIYEILRLKSSNASNKEEYTKFRLDVKKRLNIPFEKNSGENKKLSKMLSSNELEATIDNISKEQRLKFLETSFDDLVDEYRRVLDRVDSSVD